MEGVAELEKYRVGTIPSVYYVPDFLSDDEQERMLEKMQDRRKNLSFLPWWLTREQ